MRDAVWTVTQERDQRKTKQCIRHFKTYAAGNRKFPSNQTATASALETFKVIASASSP
jgi:hypothetical protein